MGGPKRKRGQPVTEPEEIIEVPEDAEDEQTEKEKRVWDAFREEHYEAIEQLPLTLHRQYTLLEELDRQVAGHTEGLLAAVKDYVATRSKLHESAQEQDLPSSINTGGGNEPATKLPERLHAASELKSTRTLLTQIASLSDSYIRASEEKVNVAEAAYNSVDRQVRMLEQSIKEQQQAMLKSGVSPEDEILNIQLASWSPPIIIPPKTEAEEAEAPNEGPTEDGQSSVTDTTKGRKRKGRAITGEQKTSDGPPRVKLLLRAAAEPDPVAEEVYCFCQKGSYGEMIACDNDGCEREWFHLGCLGLKAAPPEDEPFYCPDCLPKVKLQKGKPRGPRRKRKT